MKRFVIVNLIILLISFTALSQKKSKFKVEYDKFEDRTAIYTPPVVVKRNNILLLQENYTLKISGGFAYEGKPEEPKDFDGFVLVFESWSPRLLILEGVDELAVIADGKRLKFKTIGYEKNDPYERIGVILDKEEFDTIASANSVEMRIGNLEFSLSNKELESFRELEARAVSIQFATHGK